jgi:uncharacterized membrane protein YheB (UPF0754 family)
MNKSIVTNLVALLITVAGFLLAGRTGDVVLSTGLYALSGGVTNWLAVHMLFEKVPGFYGSGVIPARFTEFRAGIRELVMQQFFNPENLRRFMTGPGKGEGAASVLDGLIEKVNFDKAFDGLIDVIMHSSFAGMLGMLGGVRALDPLRAPFVEKMQQFLHQVKDDPAVEAELSGHGADELMERIEQIVDQRLQELTPELVKEIVQNMIHRHLGWLVVWGGVVGGLIGLGVAVFMP